MSNLAVAKYRAAAVATIMVMRPISSMVFGSAFLRPTDWP